MEGVVRTVMHMLENRMVIGEYDPPDPLDGVTAEQMAYYVADEEDRIAAVLGGMDLCDLWEYLPDDVIERISAAYVRRHVDDFLEWRRIHGQV